MCLAFAFDFGVDRACNIGGTIDYSLTYRKCVKLDLNDHGIVFYNVCILYVDRQFID